jgi:hypothetical protein
MTDRVSLLEEIKKIKTDHAERQSPYPPSLEDEHEFVLALEKELKEHVFTGRVKMLTIANGYLVPSESVQSVWWDKVRAWALSIANNAEFQADRYGCIFRGDLNDCIYRAEDAWNKAHPSVPMEIDADAFDPCGDKSLCAEFDLSMTKMDWE